MIRLKTIFLIFLLTIVSCNTDNEFNPKNLDNVLSIEIENNNALSDGVDEIEVLAKFPIDFSTEDDNKVDFTIFKESEEMISKEIELIQQNSVQKKQSSISINYNKDDSLRIKATIGINNIKISKDTLINFTKAYLNSINITSSSLTLQPNSFNEVEIITDLMRNIGKVTINSVAETIVQDSLGQARGIFNNYQNKTNEDGKIINKYTLGNDDYEGRLFVIATSLDSNNEIQSDTLILFSQN